MKLEKFKERNYKKISVIVFTVACVLLVSSVILYRTFAIFEVKANQNVINGTVEDPGNIYFAFYQKNEENGSYEIKKDMPQQGSGYVLDEEKSYCGVNGNMDEKITVSLTENYQIRIDGVTTSRTKCNLYFAKGIFLMEHGVPVVTNGNGLYKVEHGEEVLETLNDTGFRQDEYRYVGVNPNNYVDFNNEKWRIIGLVNVMTSENDVEQRIKIVKEESIGEYSWDSSESSINNGYGINEWSQADVKEMLNNFYYNDMDDDKSHNCYIDENNRYISCSFNGKDGNVKGLQNNKEMLETDIIWNTGSNKVGDVDRLSINGFYNSERSSSTSISNCNREYYCNDEMTRKVKWGKEEQENYHAIGLIYPSDYGYASFSISNCVNNLQNFSEECIQNNWLSKNLWTLMPATHSEYKSTVYGVSSNGQVTASNAKNKNNIYPVLYLKKDVKIISGIGTKENSFQLDI